MGFDQLAVLIYLNACCSCVRILFYTRHCSVIAFCHCFLSLCTDFMIDSLTVSVFCSYLSNQSLITHNYSHFKPPKLRPTRPSARPSDGHWFIIVYQILYKKVQIKSSQALHLTSITTHHSSLFRDTMHRRTSGLRSTTSPCITAAVVVTAGADLYLLPGQ
jgi:hypothetical protein